MLIVHFSFTVLSRAITIFDGIRSEYMFSQSFFGSAFDALFKKVFRTIQGFRFRVKVLD